MLLGWLLIKGVAWNEFIGQIRHFPLTTFLLALGISLIGILLRAWRWHILIAKERINFFRLFLIQNAGIGLNNLSPLRVVSEPLQLALITRRGGVSAPVGLATLAMEHMMDVFATAVLMGASVILLPQLRGFSIQLIAAIVFSLLSLLVFFLIAKGMNTFPGLKRFHFLQTAIDATKNLGKSPWRLFFSMLGTLGYWSMMGLSGWFAANALGIQVGVAAVVVLFMGSVFIVSAVPSPPGGAITFEAAVVYTLKLFGVGSEKALAFAVIMHIIMFLPPTLVALAVLPREGIRMFGRKTQGALEDKSLQEVD